jgi:actin related protein 2/3 complex subunit 3
MVPKNNISNNQWLINLNRYISQVRQEIAVRLHARLYPGGEGPSKVGFRQQQSLLVETVLTSLQFWLSFTKRKFMGKSL